MESLRIAFSVILPLFLLMALGYCLKWFRLLEGSLLDALNTLVFKVFLPVLIFWNIYKTDIAAIFDWKMLLYAVASTLVIVAALCLIVPLFEKNLARRGVLIQGIFRSNLAIFGIPVTAALFGDDRVGVTTMLIACIIPVFNALAVIVLELFGGEKIKFWRLVRNIVLNPLIIASALGILVLALGIRFPAPLESTVQSVAQVATPLSLIVLGASFEFKAVRGNIKPLLIGVIGRLVVISLIFVPLAALVFGFRDEALVALLILFAAPTSVSSFTMAGQMGGDGELAGQIVVFTSAFSIVTIFLWIFAIRSIGWI